MSSLDISDTVPDTEVAEEPNITVNVEDVPEQQNEPVEESTPEQQNEPVEESTTEEVTSSDNDLKNRIIELEEKVNLLINYNLNFDGKKKFYEKF